MRLLEGIHDEVEIGSVAYRRSGCGFVGGFAGVEGGDCDARECCVASVVGI